MPEKIKLQNIEHHEVHTSDPASTIPEIRHNTGSIRMDSQSSGILMNEKGTPLSMQKDKTPPLKSGEQKDAMTDQQEEDDELTSVDSGKNNDPKKNLVERHREKRAKKHIAQGNAIMLNDPRFQYQLPTKGNKDGVALKLKKKWVKEKFWIYYAEYLKENYGYDIGSYDEFLKLDNKVDADYFNVPGHAGGPGATDDQNKKEEKKTGDDNKTPEEKEHVEPNKKTEEKKTDQTKTSENKTLVKITQYNEKKVIITHSDDHVAVFDNKDHLGQNVDGTISLDPAKKYIVFVRGAVVKDQVSVFVNGKWVSGDPKPARGQRIFDIPAGSNSVTVHGETSDKQGSFLEIEVDLDEQTQVVYWRTIEKRYYSDGSSETKTVKTWVDDPKTVPFTKKPLIALWQQQGGETVIWEVK